MKFVFNELSINDIKGTKADGYSRIEKFILAYSYAINSKYNFDRSIVTFTDLRGIPVAENYYIAQWRNDVADKDMLRRFLSMCDRQQVHECEHYEDDLELTFNGSTSNGLLYTYLNEEICISLNTNEIWNSTIIHADLYSLLEDANEIVEIINVYESIQFTSEIDIFDTRYEQEIHGIASGRELIEKSSILYPSLKFSSVSVSQLLHDVQPQNLGAIKKKLLEIEFYFRSWDKTKINYNGFSSKITSESPSTLARFEKEYQFDIDGKIVLACFHIRYTGCIPGRIYFCPDYSTGVAWICSLTTKLPTVTDPKFRI